MGFRHVIIENPCKCSYQGGYMVVRTEDKTTKIHLSELSTVLVQSTQSFVSGYLLAELAKQKITFITCDQHANPIAQFIPFYGAHNNSKRINNQLAWTEPQKKRVWQRVVTHKIANQARLLELRDRTQEAGVLKGFAQEVRSGDATNREAVAARQYFSALFGEGFSRDDNTPVNAALDYGYAVLLACVNRELVSRGYLTQIGICHRGETNDFNLSCDLMEPFRPIIDRIVFDNNIEEMNTNTKHLLVDVLNNTIAYKDGSYKVSSVISLYVKECLNALERRLTPLGNCRI